MDGNNNNDIYASANQPFPFPDALQEFSVQTSDYSAKYGGNSGAVVNIVTKSGSNALHGDGFEFHRSAMQYKLLTALSLFNGPRDIDDVPQDEVKTALYSCLPAGGRVEREILLRQAAKSLGLARLGQRVRSRLSRAIGAEIRAGRLLTDGENVGKA